MRYGMVPIYNTPPLKESGKHQDNIQNSGKESLQSLNIFLLENAKIEMVTILLSAL